MAELVSRPQVYVQDKDRRADLPGRGYPSLNPRSDVAKRDRHAQKRHISEAFALHDQRLVEALGEPLDPRYRFGVRRNHEYPARSRDISIEFEKVRE